MQAVTTIGLDIAKSVFQVRGINAQGNVVIRRQLRAPAGSAIFQEAAILPGRRRGLRHVTSLVA